MKRIFFLLLAALLLAGCTREIAVVTGPATEAAIPATAEGTIPVTTEAAIVQTTEAAIPETLPRDADFVRVLDYLPGAYQFLPYATDDNFTGQVIYDFQDAYLRYGTVKKLRKVNEDLSLLGLTIQIWDGFRPVSAQFRLWDAVPDPSYVANPNVGFSSHSRGNTVDLTLVALNGEPLEMPTGFDDFSPLADRDYSDCTDAARNNALILESIMDKHGFAGYAGEWWHYTDTEDYPVEDAFCPQ